MRTGRTTNCKVLYNSYLSGDIHTQSNPSIHLWCNIRQGRCYLITSYLPSAFVQRVVANTNWRHNCVCTMWFCREFSLPEMLSSKCMKKHSFWHPIIFGPLLEFTPTALCRQYFFQSWRPISCIGASWTKVCLLRPTPFCWNISRQNNLCSSKVYKPLMYIKVRIKAWTTTTTIHEKVPREKLLFISVIRLRQVSQFTFPDKFF